jgi:hypothetical protein
MTHEENVGALKLFAAQQAHHAKVATLSGRLEDAKVFQARADGAAKGRLRLGHDELGDTGFMFGHAELVGSSISNRLMDYYYLATAGGLEPYSRITDSEHAGEQKEGHRPGCDGKPL